VGCGEQQIREPVSEREGGRGHAHRGAKLVTLGSTIPVEAKTVHVVAAEFALACRWKSTTKSWRMAVSWTRTRKSAMR